MSGQFPIHQRIQDDSRATRAARRRKDQKAIADAIGRLFELHRGGNDPNPQYAQLTRLIVRRANGAYKRLFGKATGAHVRSSGVKGSRPRRSQP